MRLNAEWLSVGVRVCYRDLERNNNWYFGRVVDVHFKYETETYDVKDDYGLIVKDIPKENLKRTSDLDGIVLPKRRPLPESSIQKQGPFFLSGGKKIIFFFLEKSFSKVFVSFGM